MIMKSKIMRRILNEVLRSLVAVVLIMVWLWFALSAAWSVDDMTLTEKTVGVLYSVAMVPVYYWLQRVLRLS